jgi:hypothetical protein
MPTPEEEAAQKTADETKAKDDAAKTQEKLFTQAELNAHITDRLAREKEAQAKEQEKIKLKAEQEAAEKNGEWQKLAETNEKARLLAEQERDAEREKNKSIRIESAFSAEASKKQYGDKGDLQFEYPDAAIRLAERTAVNIEGDTVTGVADALKAVAKKYPGMLVNPTQQQRVTTPTQGRQPNQQNVTAPTKAVGRTRY